MAHLSYESLSGWIETWDRLLTEPQVRELLFAPSFANLVRFCADYFDDPSRKESKTPKRRRDKELLAQLLHCYTDGDPELHLYQLDYPEEIQELKDHLLTGQNAEEYKLAEIRPLLQRLQNAPSMSTMKQELIAALTSGEEDYEEWQYRVANITHLLLDQILTRHSVSRLKGIPERVMFEHATRMLYNRISDELWSSISVDDLRTLFDATLSRSLWSDGDAVFGSPDSPMIQDVFETLSWPSAVQRYLVMAARAGLHILQDESQRGSGNDTPYSLVNVDQESVCSFGEILVREFSEVYYREVLQQTTRADGGIPKLRTEILGQQLGAQLMGALGIRDRRSQRYCGFPSPIQISAIKATQDAVVQVVSEGMAGALVESIDFDDVYRVGEHMLSLLRDAVELGDIEVDENGEISDLSITDWLAKRHVYQEAWRELQPLAHQLVSGFDPISQDVQSIIDARSSHFLRDFLRVWEERLPRHAGDTHGSLHFLPWESLVSSEIDELVDSLMMELVPLADQWIVVFRVEDLLPGGAVWGCGNVLFYDPEVLDYNEGGLLSSRDSATESLTLARVATRADTMALARRSAFYHLNEVLNALSFALSAPVPAGGFKPNVDHSRFYARNLRTGEAGSNISRRRSELTMNIKAGPQSKLVQLASNYDDFLRASVDDRGSLSDLQSQFLQWLHWYRRGRWEPDPLEQLLFYWIGLEHLFGSFGSLRKNLPLLHETWFDLPCARITRNEWTQVVSLIRDDAELKCRVESSPGLSGYSRDARILLNPEIVGELINLTPETQREARSCFVRFREELNCLTLRAAELQTEIDWRRGRFKFKLECLYLFRNQVVHQAVVTRPDVEYYADELEWIVEDTLMKISEHVLEPEPLCSELSELINIYSLPWRP
jgi:hypothetical protein